MSEYKVNCALCGGEVNIQPGGIVKCAKCVELKRNEGIVNGIPLYAMHNVRANEAYLIDSRLTTGSRLETGVKLDNVGLTMPKQSAQQPDPRKKMATPSHEREPETLPDCREIPVLVDSLHKQIYWLSELVSLLETRLSLVCQEDISGEANQAVPSPTAETGLGLAIAAGIESVEGSCRRLQSLYDRVQL